MRKKKIFSFIIIVSLVLGSVGTVYATSNKTAYIFGFNYGDGIDTTEIADQERMYLANMGYTAYCNTDVDADFAIGDSPITKEPRMNSGVFVTNGHSGPGSYEFKGTKRTWLTAKKSDGESYFKFDDIDMSNCDAALFFGCKTASTDRKSTYGVLTEQAIENKAKCSFGWKKSVKTGSAKKFRERMFYFLRKGYSVSNSAANAKSEMPWFDDTRSYVVKGDGSIKLSSSSKSLKRMEVKSNPIIDKEKDFRLVETNGNSKLFVRYIDGIATSEFYTIENGEIRKSNVNFKENNIPKLKKTNLKSYTVPNMIMSDNTKFNLADNSEVLDILVKINNEPKYVRIIKNEYVSQDGNSFFLDCTCIDIETENEIDYNLILENY